MPLLTDLYGTQGYAFANIEANPRLMEQPGELDVVYTIIEGAIFHVGEINVHIAGGDVSPHTKETVVLNRLNIRHGDLMDAREIRNGERRLKASNLFVVNPQEGDPPTIKINEPRFDGSSQPAPPRRRGTVRGQSPEQPPESPAPSIYSWDGTREPATRPTMYRAPRVPASQPRTPAPQSSSALR